jgi:hypothetical protein
MRFARSHARAAQLSEQANAGKTDDGEKKSKGLRSSKFCDGADWRDGEARFCYGDLCGSRPWYPEDVVELKLGGDRSLEETAWMKEAHDLWRRNLFEYKELSRILQNEHKPDAVEAAGEVPAMWVLEARAYPSLLEQLSATNYYVDANDTSQMILLGEAFQKDGLEYGERLRLVKEKPHYSVKASPVCAHCLRSYTAVHRALQILRGGRADWAKRYEQKVAQTKVAEARMELEHTVEMAMIHPVEKKFNYRTSHRRSPGGKDRSPSRPTSPTGLQVVQVDDSWDLGIAGKIMRSKSIPAGGTGLNAVVQGRVSMKLKASANRARISVRKFGPHQSEGSLMRSRSELLDAIDVMDDPADREMPVDLKHKVLLDVLGGSAKSPEPCYYKGGGGTAEDIRKRRSAPHVGRIGSAPPGGRRAGRRRR